MGRNNWSNETLFNHLLKNKTKRTYWDNIRELRKHGTESLFLQCVVLTDSDIEKERIVGIDILSQLSTSTEIKPFSKRVLTHFIDLLHTEKSESVLNSILIGIGHNNNNLVLDKDIKLIASFKNSEYSNIRHGVVFALLGIDNTIAIETLIDLSQDKNNDVRSWAVFGLGSQIRRNNVQIRDTLYNRINDKDQETRYEAIVGLSIIKDHRVKDIIKQELLSGSYGSLLFEAIIELKDISFLPLLEDELVKNKGKSGIDPKWIKDLEECISSLELSNSPNSLI